MVTLWKFCDIAYQASLVRRIFMRYGILESNLRTASCITTTQIPHRWWMSSAIRIWGHALRTIESCLHNTASDLTIGHNTNSSYFYHRLEFSSTVLLISSEKMTSPLPDSISNSKDRHFRHLPTRVWQSEAAITLSRAAQLLYRVLSKLWWPFPTKSLRRPPT